MAAYDVKRALPALYAPRSRSWSLLDVPDQQFLAIDGRGNPNASPAYAAAVEALYTVAYTLKFTGKRAGRDVVVAPLEGLWWSTDYRVFTTGAKDSWRWTMLLSQPDHVTGELIEAAKHTALSKKPAVGDLYRLTLHEGLCAQVLHIGPYDEEGPLLAALHGPYLEEHGLAMTGLHHEIYLSDPRRTDPTRLRTVLRQPVRPA